MFQQDGFLDITPLELFCRLILKVKSMQLKQHLLINNANGFHLTTDR